MLPFSFIDVWRDRLLMSLCRQMAGRVLFPSLRGLPGRMRLCGVRLCIESRCWHPSRELQHMHFSRCMGSGPDLLQGRK